MGRRTTLDRSSPNRISSRSFMNERRIVSWCVFSYVISYVNNIEMIKKMRFSYLKSSELLLSRILMLERAVQQNVYHRQHLDFRDLPDIPPFVLLTEDERRINKDDKGAVGGFGFGGTTSMGIGAIPTSPGSLDEKSTMSEQPEVEEDLGPQKVNYF